MILLLMIILIITYLLYCINFNLSNTLLLNPFFFTLYYTIITTSATPTFHFPYNDFYMTLHEISMILLETIHTECSYLNM